jgi:drug/metabolite transporter (DMT)-like permease
VTDEAVETAEAVLAPHEAHVNNFRGAMWMVGSALAFTVATVLIKYLGHGYAASLQSFYRQLAGFIIILPAILRDPRGAFRTTRPGILIFRSAAGTVAMIASFYAYQTMPLADANALSFTRTLWLVPIAFFMLRESLGPLRIGAALVGFAGVIIMLRPGGHAMHIGLPQLAMLLSAFLFALTIAGMKVMTRDHKPLVLLTYATVLGMLFSLPPALMVWKWPTLPDLGLLALMGLFSTLTQACYIKGMQIGDAGAMAPIDYTRLVFATGAGFLLFNEIPNGATLFGAAIVVGSTLFITWRERQIALSAGRAPVRR